MVAVAVGGGYSPSNPKSSGLSLGFSPLKSEKPSLTDDLRQFWQDPLNLVKS